MAMTALKHVTRFEYGSALALEARNEGAVPVFGSNGVTGVHDAPNTLGPAIIVGRKGSFGKVTWTERPGFCIDTAYYIDSRSTRANLRWLYWALQTLGLDQHSEDTGVPGLSREKAYQEKLRFPAPYQQERIANFLDEKTARIDALIAEKEALIEVLEESEASQILALVTGASAEAIEQLSPHSPSSESLPRGWELPALARLVSKLTNGYVGPTRNILVSDGVRYLQSLHIKAGAIDFGRGEYFVKPEWSLQHEKSILAKNDILIVQTGDIGQTALVTDDFVGCNCHALIIARPRPELVVPAFLELVLRSAYGRAAFAIYSTGALHPHLNCSNIRDIRVPCPPVPVQQQIVAEASNIQDKHRGLSMHTLSHIDRLREYRSSLISAAVTGQLNIGAFKEASS